MEEAEEGFWVVREADSKAILVLSGRGKPHHKGRTCGENPKRVCV